MENLEPVLKKIFEEHPPASADHSRPSGQTDSVRNEQKGRNRDEKQGGSDGCQSTGLRSIKTKVRILQIVILCLLFGSTSGMTSVSVKVHRAEEKRQ